MNFFRLLPVILSLSLLGAHWYRAGLVVLMAACVLLPFLLLLRRSWIPRLFQVVLLIGALEWLRTLYVVASMRVAFEQPWGRLALILGGVALFTLLSGLVFRARALRDRYGATSTAPPGG